MVSPRLLAWPKWGGTGRGADCCKQLREFFTLLATVNPAGAGSLFYMPSMAASFMFWFSDIGVAALGAENDDGRRYMLIGAEVCGAGIAPHLRLAGLCRRRLRPPDFHL